MLIYEAILSGGSHAITTLVRYFSIIGTRKSQPSQGASGRGQFKLWSMVRKYKGVLFAVMLPLHPVSAGCWAGGDSEIREFQILAVSAPLKALPQINDAVARAERSQDFERVAWLLSAKMAALLALSRDVEAGQIWDKAMALPGLTNALKAELLNRQMTIVGAGDITDIGKKIDEGEMRLKGFKSGTPASVCTKSAIAYYYRQYGDSKKAINLAGDAYREAISAGLDDEANFVAFYLSIAIFETGDLKEADALAAQVETWAQNKGYNVYGLLAKFQRALILRTTNPADAVGKFLEVAQQARQFGLTTTPAETGACLSLITTRQFDRAQAVCLSARQNVNSSEPKSVFRLELALGELALARGRPKDALAKFDALLADSDSSVLRPKADAVLSLRARAHALLGDFAAAYQDSVEAMRISAERSAALQERELGQLRARFAWDRQRLANVELERDLAQASAREQVRNIWLLTGAGWLILLATVLIWVVYSARRHRRRLEALANEAKDLARTKADLLSTMSHEIRAPLGSLVLASTQLAASPTIPEDNRRRAHHLGFAAERLLTQLDDLLLFSRIDSRQLPISPSWIDPAAVVSSSVGLLEAKADAAGMKITVSKSDDAPNEIFADPNRLGQLVTNLVDNAIKHSGGKQIDVEIGPGKGDTFVLTVKDDGAGVSEFHLSQVLQSFAQVDGSMASDQGFGLGLAISKGLAELMGGGLSLTSPPGCGLIARIHLPANAVQAAAA